MHKHFDNLMILCVALNTVALSLTRYGISQSEENVISFINNIFTYIFIFEMAIKLIGMGLKGNLREKWN